MEVNWLSFVLVALITSIFIKWLVNYFLALKRLPPGPWGVPVLGYLPWLSKQVVVDFVRLGKQYGGMFSVRLGSEMAVILNDWPSVKATFSDRGKVFSGRKANAVMNAFGQGKNIIFTDGIVWRKQRNLTMKSLKNVGAANKKSLEARLMNMIHQMIDELKSLDGQVADFDKTMQKHFAAGNWNIISDVEIIETKEEFEEITGYMNELLKAVRLTNPVAALPWLRFVPPNGFGFWKFNRAMIGYRAYLKKLIDKHYTQLDSGNDLIDNYIDEIKKHPDKEPPYTNDHLTGTVIDLVLASIETTFSTSMWGFLYLALHPEIQEKIQKELDQVVGRERLPTVEDSPNLPYLEAFIMETHRKGSVAPVAAPHTTMETVHINGYTIPKNTLVISNLYAIHHDPKYWEEPQVFRPERFIAEDGTVKIPPYLIPFSVGPRACLGQFMAELQLQLVFSCLLQNFTFLVPEDRPTPSLEPLILISRRPQPYSLQIKCRS